MNALVILSLISDLYTQVQAQQKRVDELEAKLAERDESPKPGP